MERTEQEQRQFIRMTQTPIPRLIGSLAAPTVISMLVTSVYNMADTFFVSKLGTSAAGAVGVVFSLMAIIQAVGFMLGMGSGSVISRLLGEQRREEASAVSSTAFFTALAFGLTLTVMGLLNLGGLMELLGASPTILPYAKDYASYILYGAPIMCASFVLNNNLRAQGKAGLSMVGIGLGGVLNIFLDPVFIFVLDLGIAGAAIATLLSQCVSFGVLLFFYLGGQSVTRLSMGKISRQAGVYLLIFRTGLPSLFRQGLASIATVALNVNAVAYGDSAVAAMSIVGRISMFVLSVMLGIGQGMQPVVGYNYGAGEYGRVRKAFWFTAQAGFGALLVLAVVGFATAPQVLGLFRRDDLEVIAIGALALRLQCLALPLQPIMVPTNMLFQVLGRSRSATFLSAARQGIFFLPLIALLPQRFGLLGVQMTQPLSDLCTALCCVPLLVAFFRELDERERG